MCNVYRHKLDWSEWVICFVCHCLVFCLVLTSVFSPCDNVLFRVTSFRHCARLFLITQRMVVSHLQIVSSMTYSPYFCLRQPWQSSASSLFRFLFWITGIHDAFFSFMVSRIKIEALILHQVYLNLCANRLCLNTKFLFKKMQTVTWDTCVLF